MITKQCTVLHNAGAGATQLFLKPCVAARTRHLDQPGQLDDFEQHSNTHSEQENSTDSHSARTTGEHRWLNNTVGSTTQLASTGGSTNQANKRRKAKSASRALSKQTPQRPYQRSPWTEQPASTHHRPSSISHEGAVQGRRDSRPGWRSTPPATAASIRLLHLLRTALSCCSTPLTNHCLENAPKLASLAALPILPGKAIAAVGEKAKKIDTASRPAWPALRLRAGKQH